MLQSHGEILKSNDQELRKMLEVFRSKRKGLVQQIRLAIPGLARTDGAITVDTKVVESTNEAVRKALGKESGLIIAFFLAELDRNPDASGKIRLTGKEYEELTRHQIKATHPKTKTLAPEVKTRILCNCLARDQSIQILGPVAVDLWAGIAFIKIEGLISTDQAIQFGYPVPLDVFRETLDRQDKRIATSRTKELHN
ncbi:uncharacterized protein PAC_01041 [Phialocephala subalpina]|uniref:Uncharacterized protein n=1 Tax=Phialocephala subalpina TaxID=576137 RepID=A0A1L7WEG9_9HELO|nr:uncharacterized protein PAC_01041 [Phialocephala subalpina]